MDPLNRPEVRWGLGCLISAIAVTGTLILVLLVAIVAQPPVWLQIVIGLGLVAGGALFAWLVTSALTRARTERVKSDPRLDRRRNRP